MSVTFINWTSRVAIAARIAEWHRHSNNREHTQVLGGFCLPFGKTEARAEAGRWLRQL